MPLTPIQLTNLHTIAIASIKCELLSSIPKDFMCAQCILESAWLKASPGNNCFGIKDYTGAFGRQLLPTREWLTPKELAWFLHLGDRRTAELVDPTGAQAPNAQGRQQYRVMEWFATFPDLASCFARRASLFLQHPYSLYLPTYVASKNFDQYLRSIAHIYATDPSYADKIMAIIRMPEVGEALEDAKDEVERQSA